MTLSSTLVKNSYNGDGATATFAVTFVFWDEDDLQVVLTDANDVETIWTRGTQYTVTKDSPTGATTGNVVIVTTPTDYTPASGTTLTIISNLSDVQNTSLPLGGQFPSPSVEQQLDKATRLIQQRSEELDRTPKFPVNETSSSIGDLPSLTNRIGKFLVFDAAGKPTASVGSGTDTGLRTDLAASSGSALIGYNQGGTGAVSRTQESKNQDIVSVKDFGAVGDGVTDDTTAIQAAHDATQGQTLFFPKGKYLISSSITNTATMNHWLGEYGGRDHEGGTELSFSGTGGVFENGTDNGFNWGGSYFDGPQDQFFENLWFSHSAPDTTLNYDVAQKYKAGASGIRDWRGGGIKLRNIGFERFEYNFFGVQSDINRFYDITSLYSKYGIYLGPRTDQFTMHDLYSFSCDHAITIDTQATDSKIVNPVIVGCGSATDHAILIKQGAGFVVIENPWLEHLSGYSGTDQIAFIGIGTEAGYSLSPYTTDSVKGVRITNPFAYTTAASTAYHTKYLAEIGKGLDVHIYDPQTEQGSGENLDYFIAFQSGTAYLGSDTYVKFRVHNDFASKVYINNGTGTPDIMYELWGAGANKLVSTNGRLFLNKAGAAAGADELQIGQEGIVGGISMEITNAPSSGQTNRFLLRQAFQQKTAMPTSGNYEIGDFVMNITPAETGTAGSKYIILGWSRVTTGSGNVLNTDWFEMRCLTGN